ncbi:hypothetical protein IscW_ISCW003912 [Ixodes scapularis]|uniref:Uncharacterized protein n=1 Tax=Ixodes scapularis TaxID=6945 RepID=B7PJR9_IXOSC|nr:hypothetical protein IscW_ISCW003912 [Ixodes scapularis]|eukprot:XP_002408433.1 hypothetical protein IscW_ISCW003912 [Ixodes scapularis]
MVSSSAVFRYGKGRRTTLLLETAVSGFRIFVLSGDRCETLCSQVWKTSFLSPWRLCQRVAT